MSGMLEKRQEMSGDNRNEETKLKEIKNIIDSISTVKEKIPGKPKNQEQIKGFFKTFGDSIGKFVSGTAVGLGQLAISSVIGLINGTLDATIGKNLENAWLAIEPHWDKIVIWIEGQLYREKMRKAIDEIYKSDFHISVNSKGNFEGKKYTLKNEKGETIRNKTEPLDIFNKDAKLSEVFEDVIIERSMTARGVHEMGEIVRHLGVDITKKEDVQNISPDKLAQAYENVYKGKNMPAEVKDFIENTKKGAFQTKDMKFVQDAIGEYSDIVSGTKSGLTSVKEAAIAGGNGIMDMFTNPTEALSKVKNPISLLFLIGSLAYGLFFSEHKKKVWGSLAVLFGGDALVSMIHPDGKGLFNLSKDGLKMFEGADGILKEKGFLKKISEQPNELAVVTILMNKKAKDILNKTTIEPGGNVVLSDYSIFDKKEIEALKKVFKTEQEYKSTINKMLHKFLEESGKNKKESSANTLLRLKQQYIIPGQEENTRFGEVLFLEIGLTDEQRSQVTKNQPTQTQVVPEATKIAPVQKSSVEQEIAKIANNGIKNSIQSKYEKYKSSKSESYKKALKDYISFSKNNKNLNENDRNIIKSLETKIS